jgi:hypothetical protein
MSPKTREKLLRLALLPLATAALVVAGCSSGSMTTTGTQSNAVTGSTFVVGTDAPMAAVTSFQVTLASVQLIPSGGGTPVSMISGTPTVDFARYNGLQTLLDMNDVPEGTYGSVQITLNSAGTIGYLSTGSGAPTIATMPANISPAMVTITLPKPLVVKHATAPAGLRIDFDLAQSIEVSNGAITGNVNPTFDVRAVANTDNGGYIDEFVAGVVSVNQTGQSFVVQGPHGEQFTIDVNGQTDWDGGASLSALATDGANAVVQVSGKLDPADQTLDADEVAILTDSGFYATGQITYVTPATGAATGFDLYVRGLEPTNTGLTLGQIAQINLTGNEKYYIYWMHNPFTNFFFNSSALTAGQAVAVGGPATGAVNASDVTVKRIHLRNWGFNGTIVKGSQNSGGGSFQMQVNGFAGVLIPQTVTVYLGGRSDFRYGFGAFNDLADGAKIRVVGLLLKNPTTGQVVLLGRHVDGFNFADMTTAAWQ